MLIEVSSRICFYHVAKCFQDDSQIQDQMLQHLQCRHCIIWIWSVFLHSEVSATDQRMRQSVAESLSLSQNKRLLLYQTLWECLMCHYSNIYPLLPMNLSTDLSIRRQRNPLCPKIFLFLIELDMCRVGVASSSLPKRSYFGPLHFSVRTFLKYWVRTGFRMCWDFEMGLWIQLGKNIAFKIICH